MKTPNIPERDDIIQNTSPRIHKLRSAFHLLPYYHCLPFFLVAYKVLEYAALNNTCQQHQHWTTSALRPIPNQNHPSSPLVPQQNCKIETNYLGGYLRGCILFNRFVKDALMGLTMFYKLVTRVFPIGIEMWVFWSWRTLNVSLCI